MSNPDYQNKEKKPRNPGGILYLEEIRFLAETRREKREKTISRKDAKAQRKEKKSIEKLFFRELRETVTFY